MLGMEEEHSECSSGCESGWTMYLDQSIGKPTSLSAQDNVFSCKNGEFFGGKGGEKEGEEEEEEEDLSMISDASSGPPHFHEEDDYVSDENICFCIASSTALAKKSGKRRVHSKDQHRPSYLDDTASSHDLRFSKSSFNLTNKQASMDDILDFSIGFSATHFKGKSALQKRYSFLEKSLPGKPTSSKPVCREESRNQLW